MFNVLAALGMYVAPSVANDVSGSSVIPFLVPRRSLAHAHCLSAVQQCCQYKECKTWMQSEFKVEPGRTAPDSIPLGTTASKNIYI